MTPPNGPQDKDLNRSGNLPGTLLHRLTFIALAIGVLGCALFANAAPRPAWPPFPEQFLATYRFNDVDWHPPLLPPAIGFENASVQESWSEYALIRDGLSIGPVAVPTLDSTGRRTLAASTGSVRFWFCPDWSSSQNGGEGPGCYARLLELVDMSASTPDVRWSLYVGEAGDTVYLSGTESDGKAKDFLKAEAGFVADEWQMITLNYGPEGSALWLGDQLVAEGDEVPAPAEWQDPSLGLIVGSDLGVTSPAQGQFEEVTTFDYWPDAEQLEFYHNGVGRQAFLGTVGSAEEEALKQELLAAMFPQTTMFEQQGLVMQPMAYSYSSNELWLEITGVTNGAADFVIHSPSVEPYDLFMTTNLASDVPGLNFTNWVWEVRADNGVTNISRSTGTNPIAFYRLGTTNDTDADGLTDAFENLVYHTDADLEDTDGDGMSDGQEIELGADPNDPDSDDDGVIDQPFAVHITYPKGGML